VVGVILVMVGEIEMVVNLISLVVTGGVELQFVDADSLRCQVLFLKSFLTLQSLTVVDRTIKGVVCRAVYSYLHILCSQCHKCCRMVVCTKCYNSGIWMSMTTILY
jgi:hypothetical protein